MSDLFSSLLHLLFRAASREHKLCDCPVALFFSFGKKTVIYFKLLYVCAHIGLCCIPYKSSSSVVGFFLDGTCYRTIGSSQLAKIPGMCFLGSSNTWILIKMSLIIYQERETITPLKRKKKASLCYR